MLEIANEVSCDIEEIYANEGKVTNKLADAYVAIAAAPFNLAGHIKDKYDAKYKSKPTHVTPKKVDNSVYRIPNKDYRIDAKDFEYPGCVKYIERLLKRELPNALKDPVVRKALNEGIERLSKEDDCKYTIKDYNFGVDILEYDAHDGIYVISPNQDFTVTGNGSEVVYYLGAVLERYGWEVDYGDGDEGCLYVTW